MIGSGGREHALALALAKSPRVSSVICVPGNGGCSGGKLRRANVPIKAPDFAELIAFCQEHGIVVQAATPLARSVIVIANESVMCDTRVGV